MFVKRLNRVCVSRVEGGNLTWDLKLALSLQEICICYDEFLRLDDATVSAKSFYCNIDPKISL